MFLKEQWLVERTRPASEDAPGWVQDSVQWGAGPRAIQFLIRGAKAEAVIHGHNNSEDLDSVAEAVLDHRIIATSTLDLKELQVLMLLAD